MSELRVKLSKPPTDGDVLSDNEINLCLYLPLADIAFVDFVSEFCAKVDSVANLTTAERVLLVEAMDSLLAKIALPNTIVRANMHTEIADFLAHARTVDTLNVCFCRHENLDSQHPNVLRAEESLLRFEFQMPKMPVEPRRFLALFLSSFNWGRANSLWRRADAVDSN